MVQPKPKRQTEHADKLLAALRDNPEWMDRSAIAEAIGKKRLTPYDIALLDLLSERDLIEVSQKEGYSPRGYKWMYRAK